MKKYRTLAIILAVFLLTRIIVLLTSIDVLFNSEDLSMGAVAREIISGAHLPLFEYSYLTYSGGMLVVGILAVPFFLVFGPTYFALKLVPLAFSTATLALLYLFCRDFFNRRTAVIVAFLYIFSSAVWCAFTVYAGFHVESLVFSMAAVYLSFLMIFKGKRGPARCFFLGLLCGFGTYFSYTTIVVWAVLAAVWAIHEPAFFRRRGFYVMLGGFIVGFSPWIAYNMGCHFRGVTDVLPEFSEGKSVFAAGTWKGFLGNYLRSLWFSRMLEMKFLPYGAARFYGFMYTAAYWVSFFAIAASFGHSFKRFLKSREFLILAAPLVLLAVVRLYGEKSLETQAVEPRYLIGLYPFIFLTVGIAAERAVKIRLSSRPVVLFVVCAALAVAAVFSRTIDYTVFGKALRLPGYSYYYLAETFNYNHPDDFYKVLDNISRVRAPERYEVLMTRMTFDFVEDIVPVPYAEYVRLAGRFAPKYRPYLYSLFARGLFYSSEAPFGELTDRIGALAAQTAPEYRPYLYEGEGALAVKRYRDDPARCVEMASFIPPEYRPQYYRGLGASTYDDDILNYVRRCKGLLAAVGAEHEPRYLDGVGETMAKFAVTTFMVGLSYDDEGLTAEYGFIRGLDDARRQWLLRGAGKGLAYYYDDNTRGDISRFIDYLAPADRRVVVGAMRENLL